MSADTSEGSSPARLYMVTIDCPDPRELAAFYSRLLGWETTASEAEYAMVVGGGLSLGFGRVEPYAPPAWPDETGAKQFHLDFSVDDVETTEQRCVQLGATVPDHQPGEGWRVLLDPAGHPFCIFPTP